MAPWMILKIQRDLYRFGLVALLARVNGLHDLARLFAGSLYDAPEKDTLAQVLRAFCMLSPQKRRAISSGSTKLVQEEFSVARCVCEYCDIYQSGSRA